MDEKEPGKFVELATNAAISALRAWNGGSGFPDAYFQTNKGKSIVKAVTDVLMNDLDTAGIGTAQPSDLETTNA